ncbi:9257_t:CDS:1, partial [Cetraspora pellucida]
PMRLSATAYLQVPGDTRQVRTLRPCSTSIKRRALINRIKLRFRALLDGFGVNIFV